MAGLSLDKSFINRVLHRETIKQSVIYQDIKDEGRQEGGQSPVLRLLARRVGEIAPEVRWSPTGLRPSQVQALSLEQTESLAEALLDFTERADLENWLKTRLR